MATMSADRGSLVVNYDGVANALPQVEDASELRAAVPDPEDAVRLHAALAHVQLTLRDAQKHPDVLVSPSDPVTARFQSFVAKQARAEGKVAALGTGGAEAKYDKHDLLGWLVKFPLEWLAGRRRHRFLPIPELEPIADQTRLGLFSDWGTGLYGAPRIQAALESDTERLDYVVHLGDVYYAGTDDEYRENFLAYWPRRAGTIGRALNGNHEMYFGGRGYFQVGLAALEQPSSVFALQNEHWLVVGLDSAYQDSDLGNGQAEWLQGLLANSGNRRVILLSHHQPYSNTGGAQGVNLHARLARLLDQQKIFAWYWGHEHVCALYDPHPLWGLHGRCIGHGGIPEFRHDVKGLDAVQTTGENTWYRLDGPAPNPSCLFLDGPNPFVPGHAGQYLPHGYVTVTLDGAHLLEELRDPTGAVVHTSKLA
jgi:hypothetical protein